MRVVLDTVVFVRALINARNYSGQILSEFSTRYTLLISRETARELLEVIRRPELARKYKRITAINIESIIEILAHADVITLTDIPEVVRDAKNDIVISTAQTGNADYLVTEDKDLLVLNGQFQFEIITPKTFIDHLSQS